MLPATIAPESPEANYLQSVLQTQAQMQPASTDAFALLTRYIFIPFWNRELSFEEARNMGGMPTLEAGFIIPIIKYQAREMAYEEIAKVTIDPFVGGYMWTPFGVSEEKFVQRAPREVVESIFETFNREHSSGGQMDNGICEIDVLRGNQQFDAEFTIGRATQLSALNRHCLPHRYTSGLKQAAQLQSAVSTAPSQLYSSVAERLLQATRQSIRWAEARYRLLERQIEGGKNSFFPIDEAVCAWIEQPMPKRRSNLVGGDTGVVAPRPTAVTPTIWCESCGTNTNLSPEGRAPRFCPSCREPFGQGEAQLPAAEMRVPVASEGEQREFAETVGDGGLERKQQEMKDRQQGKRR